MIYNRKPIIINNDNINTISIAFVYPSIVKENENRLNGLIINQLLNTSTNTYKLDSEYFNKKKELNIINLSIDYRYVGNILNYMFTLTVPKEGIIDDFNLEECIKFFYDVIYNPISSNDAFDEERFLREKSIVVGRKEREVNSIYQDSISRFSKMFDKDNRLYLDLDTGIKLAKSLNNKDSYTFYKEHVMDNKFIPFIYGNINEKELLKLLNKYFDIKDEEIDVPGNFFDIFKLDKENYKEENNTFKQSCLFSEFQVEDYKEEDSKYLDFVIDLLSSRTSNVLFNTFRIENSLVYDCYLDDYKYKGLYLISLYLDKKNKDKAISLLDTLLDKIKDIDYIKSAHKKILKSIELALKEQEDSEYEQFNKVILKTLKVEHLTDIYESYKNIDYEELLKFINRIKRTNMLFIEGDNND